MRSEGYVVAVSFCLSVKRYLTSGASVCPENALTYSAGNEGQNKCSVFSKIYCFGDGVLPPFPADNTHAHFAYASSARFAIDAPCRKLSLRSV